MSTEETVVYAVPPISTTEVLDGEFAASKAPSYPSISNAEELILLTAGNPLILAKPSARWRIHTRHFDSFDEPNRLNFRRRSEHPGTPRNWGYEGEEPPI